MKYIEGIVCEDISVGKKVESPVSQMKYTETIISGTSDGSKKEGRNDEEKATDRSKFKKVKMPIFNGTNPNSWLF